MKSNITKIIKIKSQKVQLVQDSGFLPCYNIDLELTPEALKMGFPPIEGRVKSFNIFCEGMDTRTIDVEVYTDSKTAKEFKGTIPKIFRKNVHFKSYGIYNVFKFKLWIENMSISAGTILESN